MSLIYIGVILFKSTYIFFFYFTKVKAVIMELVCWCDTKLSNQYMMCTVCSLLMCQFEIWVLYPKQAVMFNGCLTFFEFKQILFWHNLTQFVLCKKDLFNTFKWARYIRRQKKKNRVSKNNSTLGWGPIFVMIFLGQNENPLLLLVYPFEKKLVL